MNKPLDNTVIVNRAFCDLRKFISIIILLFLSRFYDAYTTYLYIPDLKNETNILISTLNLGWTGALAIQLAGLLFVTYTFYVFCFKEVKIESDTSNLNMKEFISAFYFNDSNKSSQLLFKSPTNKNSILYTLGGIVPIGLIIIGLIVGTSTSCLILSEEYEKFYRTFHIPFVLYSLIFVILSLLTINFFRKEKNKIKD